MEGVVCKKAGIGSTKNVLLRSLDWSRECEREWRVAWRRERESHIQSLKIGEGAHVGNRSSEEVVAQDPASD